MSKGCILTVYKKDRRFKKGERLQKSYFFQGYSASAMINTINNLQQQLYKTSDGWRLDFVEAEFPNK